MYSKYILDIYKELIEKNKDKVQWAVHKKYEPEKLVSCTVPLIGKSYFEQSRKILVYASAEVLSDYYPGGESERPWLDDDSIAIDRHRWFLDNPEKQQGRFFPNIHIQPMNDGALMTAVGYILSKLQLLDDDATPFDVCEKISVGNYGKYTVETEYQKKMRTGISEGESKRNIDTAEKPDELFVSRDFVRADFSILKPDYVIMPSEIYKTEKSFIDEIAENAIIILIYQMNSGNVNRIIHRKYEKYDIDKLHPAVHQWYLHLHDNGLTGKTKENYLSVFTYLDYVMERHLG